MVQFLVNLCLIYIIISHWREITTRQLLCYKLLIFKYMDLVGIKFVVFFNVTSCRLVDDNQKHKWFCCAYLLSWWLRQPCFPQDTQHHSPQDRNKKLTTTRKWNIVQQLCLSSFLWQSAKRWRKSSIEFRTVNFCCFQHYIINFPSSSPPPRN
jgi:hypothetical protein